MTDDERKASQRERTARYRVRHHERVLAQGRAQSKKWHAAHREESIAASKAYYLAHRVLAPPRVKVTREQQLARRRVTDAKWRASPEQRAKALARTVRWNRAHPEHARALMRTVDAKRRALQKQVFVEAVDPRVVFTRDSGMCGICLETVDPMSCWEVDHVVPIAKGGLHSYANVQPAHRRCNRSKGAKLCTY
jgi:5-methylcytosine-specific restriction endonuclease McrA